MLGLSGSYPIFKKYTKLGLLFKRISDLFLTIFVKKSNFYGKYLATASNESKMCGEKTHTLYNDQVSFFYLYTKLTKFMARSIN